MDILFLAEYEISQATCQAPVFKNDFISHVKTGWEISFSHRGLWLGITKWVWRRVIFPPSFPSPRQPREYLTLLTKGSNSLPCVGGGWEAR